MNPDPWIDEALRGLPAADQAEHPPSAELAAYVAGGLSDLEGEEILRHLEICAACVREVHALAEIARLGEGELPAAEEIEASWRQFQELLAASGEAPEASAAGDRLSAGHHDRLEAPPIPVSWPPPRRVPAPPRRPFAELVAFPAGRAVLAWAAVATLALLGTLLLWRAQGRAPGLEGPGVNVEVVNLVPLDESTRREARPAPAAGDLEAPTRYVLILNVADPRTFAAYRVEITELDGQRRIWESSGLARGRLGNFTLDLPAASLPAGPCRIVLLGLGQGDPEKLAEYRFQAAGR